MPTYPERVCHYCHDGEPACRTRGMVQLVPGQGRATLSTLVAETTCGNCVRTVAWRAAQVEAQLSIDGQLAGLAAMLDRLRDSYNAHTHPTGIGPTAPLMLGSLAFG